MAAEETIVGVATAVGDAGVAIVRISGPAAVAVAAKVFRCSNQTPVALLPSHQLTLGAVVAEDEGALDRAMIVVMRAPRSYTREDVVELHCHGGAWLVRRVVAAVQAAGARLAEPGEFTRRAFVSGRIDLSQAEAVMDVIRARSDRALRVALRQLQGELGAAVADLRRRLLAVLAQIEADLDFPEEMLEVDDSARLQERIKAAAADLQRLLAGAGEGRALREGVRLVIAGRPNVGKSSLLNRLARSERAIVTAIAGTTRDVVTEWISIGGIPAVISDTAGIREGGDLVERMGIERSRQALAEADLVLLVVDATAGLTAADRQIWAACGERAVVAVANKIDLVDARQRQAVAAELTAAGARAAVAVSAATGEGLDSLETAVAAIAAAGAGGGGHEVLVSNVRHAELLRQAAEHLQAALAAMHDGLGAEFVAIDVRAAWEALGEITGETVTDDLLDRIFADFCIGK